MPKRLDRAERRSELVRAVWRIVQRDGVPAASVRGVAKEAGLSMGSVRHFFSTQDELLRFALREVIDTARARIEAGAQARASMAREGRPVEAALDLLEQVLPLDGERLAEARIYTAFVAETATDPGMAAIRREADSGVRQLCHDVLTGLAELDHVDPSRDREVETERLWSLLDGLATHHLLDPVRTPADQVRQVLRIHLADLHTAPRPTPR